GDAGAVRAPHGNSVLAATPRGSKPTMSNRARRSDDRSMPPATNSRPEPPGPPGSTSSEPIRSPGRRAGSSLSDSSIVRPVGLVYSSGTRRVAHFSRPPQLSQVIGSGTNPAADDVLEPVELA